MGGPSGLNSRPLVGGFCFPGSREEQECAVQFLHVRLPSVPIKVIRANAFDPECCVLVARDATGAVIEGACVWKDHVDVEFREIKYFCAFTPGTGVGRRMMDFIKQDAVKQGIMFIVLYGSNTATGFFEKQLFYPLAQIKGISRTMVIPRVEAYQRSVLMAVDLVEEFKLTVDASDIFVGMKVKVRCGMRRVTEEEAVVKEISSNQRILVHFSKWSDEFDEWVLPHSKRLVRLPPVADRKSSESSRHAKKRKIAPY